MNFTSLGVGSSSVDRQSVDHTASSDDEQCPGTTIDPSPDDCHPSTSLDRHRQEQHDRPRPSPLLVNRHPNNTSSTTPLPPAPSFDKDSSPTVMSNLVQSYTTLLLCPACSPPSRLVGPTTLHCGHTVCSRHVRTKITRSSPSPPSSSRSVETSASQGPSRERETPNTPVNSTVSVPIVPSCPLPTCRPRLRDQVVTPRIPPNSTVAYYPPIPQPTTGAIESTRVTVSEPRLDVSVGRILHLLEKAEGWEDPRKKEVTDAEDTDATDDDSQEDEHEGKLATDVTSSGEQTPGARRNRRRSGRTSEARKRLRRNDLTDGRHYQHSTQEELEDVFKKELSESLTCEICFMLLYQPVTTPCQHVRIYRTDMIKWR